jgi:hypothetical protein
MGPSDRDRRIAGFEIALTALGVVALILFVAKHQVEDMKEELTLARAGEQKARDDLNAAMDAYNQRPEAPADGA